MDIDQLVQDRRHFHMHPELAFQEMETAAFVAARLRSLGIETTSGIAETGVVGLIRGGTAGKTILLRADMDALPIDEQTDVPYRSTRPGVMHACGHDGHTAILLGVAAELQARRDQLKGTVKLVFQPAEEGPGGALPMIEAGVLENPFVDAAFGLHLGMGTPGCIGLRAGAVSANSDTFELTVTGRGAHAASPHKSIDTVLAAAHIVVALQTIVAREVEPFQPAVLTVSMVQAGTASNVIPDTARIVGTVRTMDSGLRQAVRRRLEEVAVNTARAMRADCTVAYRHGYPSVINHPAMTELVRSVALDTLGPDSVKHKPRLMGAEDFGYFAERVPSCFFSLCAGREYGNGRGGHTATFDFDESALAHGVRLMTAIAERFLNEESPS